MDFNDAWIETSKLDTEVFSKYAGKIAECLRPEKVDAELDILQRTIDFLRVTASDRKQQLESVKDWRKKHPQKEEWQ